MVQKIGHEPKVARQGEDGRVSEVLAPQQDEPRSSCLPEGPVMEKVFDVFTEPAYFPLLVGVGLGFSIPFAVLGRRLSCPKEEVVEPNVTPERIP